MKWGSLKRKPKLSLQYLNCDEEMFSNYMDIKGVAGEHAERNEKYDIWNQGKGNSYCLVAELHFEVMWKKIIWEQWHLTFSWGLQAKCGACAVLFSCRVQ